MSEIHKCPAVYSNISYLRSLSQHCVFSVWKYIFSHVTQAMKTFADSAENKQTATKTAETTAEEQKTEWDCEKTTASNYLHSVAGRTQAATSLCNKLQMRRHYKAMLMRPVTALWDCHPLLVNVNLSSNVHQRAWRGMEEAERNNNQHLEPSCLHKACSHSTPFSPSHVFSSSFAWSLTSSRPCSMLPHTV